MLFPYQIGQEYNRVRDLHEPFGGSRQSGMCPCANYPIIFLFTGSGGEQHGYEDRFTDDGRFLYTGEGQIGHMEFVKGRGNAALRDHITAKKHVLVFEQTRKGHCRYLGEFTYIGHQWETRPDRDGNPRQAIIFELAKESLELATTLEREATSSSKSYQKLPRRLSLEELRSIAISGSSKTVQSKTMEARLYYRSNAVKQYALARSNGVCEYCGHKAPFKTKQGAPYLEVHHLLRVADGGPDSPDGVAALCPNCHRNIHLGSTGADINDKLIRHISTKERHTPQ